MQEIYISEQEFFDERTQMFFSTKPTTVKLVHSLISVAKWEGLWKKPYFPSTLYPGISGSTEELSYIKCMLIGNHAEHIPGLLQRHHADTISDYINDTRSATTIHRLGGGTGGRRGSTVTAEVIYYWMIKFQIPFECDRWHLSRLIMLIDVCNVKENQGKGDKMNALDSSTYRQKLNEARRAQT